MKTDSGDSHHLEKIEGLIVGADYTELPGDFQIKYMRIEVVREILVTVVRESKNKRPVGGYIGSYCAREHPCFIGVSNLP